jgi:hypothetical protein
MAAEIIHSVFVSSTFEDLRPERGELQKAILRLKCFPIGMELFPSSDEDTWEFIKRQIDSTDYYIVVIAGRYGSIAADGTSYTEMEYNSFGEYSSRFWTRKSNTGVFATIYYS